MADVERLPKPEADCCMFAGSATTKTLEEFREEFKSQHRREHCRDCPMHKGRQ